MSPILIAFFGVIISIIISGSTNKKYQDFLKFLQEKNAYSPATAVAVDSKLQNPLSNNNWQIFKMNQFKVTPEGKYWIDKVELEKYTKQLNILKAVIVSAIILTSVIFLLINIKILNPRL